MIVLAYDRWDANSCLLQRDDSLLPSYEGLCLQVSQSRRENETSIQICPQKCAMHHNKEHQYSKKTITQLHIITCVKNFHMQDLLLSSSRPCQADYSSISQIWTLTVREAQDHTVHPCRTSTLLTIFYMPCSVFLPLQNDRLIWVCPEPFSTDSLAPWETHQSSLALWPIGYKRRFLSCISRIDHYVFFKCTFLDLFY